MRLKQLQAWMRRFEKDRMWDYFPSSLIFTHLTEETAEIGEHILFEEGYKMKPSPNRTQLTRQSLGSEFAQVLTLLAQLANRFHVDLETALAQEVKVMEQRFDAETWIEHIKALKRKARAADSD